MATYCFPRFSGVPGTTANSLDWWTGYAAPALDFRFFPDDPDWIDSFAVGHGDGASVGFTFQALCGNTNFLFLSWIVRVAPLPTLNRDGVDLVIGSGTNFALIKMRLATTSTQVSSTNMALEVYSCTGAGANITLGTLVAPSPSWLTDTARIWQNYNSSRSGISIPWAYQIAIPLGVTLAGTAVKIDPNTDFKFWYNVRRFFPAGVGVTSESFPGTLKATGNLAADSIPAGLLAVMGDGRADHSGAGACTAGVKLNGAHIMIDSPIGATARPPTERNQIKVDMVGVPPATALPKHQNRFIARPDISGIGTGDKADIKATFRIANWGTQIGAVNTATSWLPIPRGVDVNFDTTLNELHFTFPTGPTSTDPAQAGDYTWLKNFINGVKSGSRVDHQCVLVTLTSTSAVVFAKSSAFNNMLFRNGSVVREAAEVSVVGLTPLDAAQPRDVYLYVQKVNMPPIADTGYIQSGVANFLRTLSRRYEEGQHGPNSQVDTYEELIEFAPTYQIHAFHDSGLKMSYEDGTEVPILDSQTSFGMFVNHEGPIVGWETRLYGAEKITDDLYVVRVPNNGAARVQVAVQARETDSEQPLPETENIGCVLMIIQWLEKQGEIGKALAVIVRVIVSLIQPKGTTP